MFSPISVENLLVLIILQLWFYTLLRRWILPDSWLWILCNFLVFIVSTVPCLCPTWLLRIELLNLWASYLIATSITSIITLVRLIIRPPYQQKLLDLGVHLCRSVSLLLFILLAKFYLLALSLTLVACYLYYFALQVKRSQRAHQY